jgi:hypothetical protein
VTLAGNRETPLVPTGEFFAWTVKALPGSQTLSVKPAPRASGSGHGATPPRCRQLRAPIFDETWALSDASAVNEGSCWSVVCLTPHRHWKSCVTLQQPGLHFRLEVPFSSIANIIPPSTVSSSMTGIRFGAPADRIEIVGSEQYHTGGRRVQGAPDAGLVTVSNLWEIRRRLAYRAWRQPRSRRLAS